MPACPCLSAPACPCLLACLQRHGLGDSALGSVEQGDRVPDWLVKWTALVSGWAEQGWGLGAAVAPPQYLACLPASNLPFLHLPVLT